MGFNVFSQDSNTVKLNDTYLVYIQWDESEELQDITHLVTNITIPQPKWKEETQYFGNNAFKFILPDYDSVDNLQLELIEPESLDASNIASKIMSYVFDFSKWQYVERNIPYIKIVITDNNFTRAVYQYEFKWLKIASVDNYSMSYADDTIPVINIGLSFMHFVHNMANYKLSEDQNDEARLQEEAAEYEAENEDTYMPEIPEVPPVPEFPPVQTDPPTSEPKEGTETTQGQVPSENPAEAIAPDNSNDQSTSGKPNTTEGLDVEPSSKIPENETNEERWAREKAEWDAQHFDADGNYVKQPLTEEDKARDKEILLQQNTTQEERDAAAEQGISVAELRQKNRNDAFAANHDGMSPEEWAEKNKDKPKEAVPTTAPAENIGVEPTSGGDVPAEKPAEKSEEAKPFRGEELTELVHTGKINSKNGWVAAAKKAGYTDEEIKYARDSFNSNAEYKANWNAHVAEEKAQKAEQEANVARVEAGADAEVAKTMEGIATKDEIAAGKAKQEAEHVEKSQNLYYDAKTPGASDFIVSFPTDTSKVDAAKQKAADADAQSKKSTQEAIDARKQADASESASKAADEKASKARAEADAAKKKADSVKGTDPMKFDKSPKEQPKAEESKPESKPVETPKKEEEPKKAETPKEAPKKAEEKKEEKKEEKPEQKEEKKEVKPVKPIEAEPTPKKEEKTAPTFGANTSSKKPIEQRSYDERNSAAKTKDSYKEVREIAPMKSHEEVKDGKKVTVFDGVDDSKMSSSEYTAFHNARTARANEMMLADEKKNGKSRGNASAYWLDAEKEWSEGKLDKYYK